MSWESDEVAEYPFIAQLAEPMFGMLSARQRSARAAFRQAQGARPP